MSPKNPHAVALPMTPNFFSQFTADQLRAGYARNAQSLRGMADKAQRTGRKVNGFTFDDLNEKATTYERLSRASDEVIRVHIAQAMPRKNPHAVALGRKGGHDSPATVGDFITVPAWKVSGQVIDTRPAILGSEDAIEVLLETRPDDPRPRWYRLEPTEYTIEETSNAS